MAMSQLICWFGFLLAQVLMTRCAPVNAGSVVHTRLELVDHILHNPCSDVSRPDWTHEGPHHEERLDSEERRRDVIRSFLQQAIHVNGTTRSIIASMAEARNLKVDGAPWPLVGRFKKLNILEGKQPENLATTFEAIHNNTLLYTVYLSHLWRSEQYWDGSVASSCQIVRNPPSYASHFHALLSHLMNFTCHLQHTMVVLGVKPDAPTAEAAVNKSMTVPYCLPPFFDYGDRMAYCILNTFADDFLQFVIDFLRDL